MAPLFHRAAITRQTASQKLVHLILSFHSLAVMLVLELPLGFGLYLSTEIKYYVLCLDLRIKCLALDLWLWYMYLCLAVGTESSQLPSRQRLTAFTRVCFTLMINHCSTFIYTITCMQYKEVKVWYGTDLWKLNLTTYNAFDIKCMCDAFLSVDLYPIAWTCSSGAWPWPCDSGPC